jgi:hypothetical protein
VILRGVLEIPLNQLFGLSIFLLVLAGIFLALPWMTTLSEQVKISKHQIIELEPES